MGRMRWHSTSHRQALKQLDSASRLVLKQETTDRAPSATPMKKNQANIELIAERELLSQGWV